MRGELQNRRTKLLTKFRPDDRLVREVDAQIRTTRDALAKAESQTATEQATDLNPLRQTLETELSRARLEQTGAQARRDTLGAQLRDYESSLQKLEGNTTKHNDLQRQAKEAVESISSVVIAEASARSQISSTLKRPLLLAPGVFCDGLLSLGTVFSAEML